MIKQMTVRRSALAVFSMGVLTACGTQGIDPTVSAVNNAQSAAAPLQVAGQDARGLTVRAGTVQAGASGAYEARKAAKGDDGSIAQAIPQAEDNGVLDIDDDIVTSPGWRFRLEASKTTFVLGEPVVVRTTLQNISAQAMPVSPLMQPEFHMASYTITRPDGTEYAFTPLAQYCTMPLLTTRTLEPGAMVSEDVKLFTARSGWAFKQVGDYIIRADFTGTNPEAARMLSNTLRIRVLPGTAAEQAAAKITMQGEAALLLNWEQGDHLKNGLADLEHVAATYPDTIHALYAGYVLGSNDALSFFNGKSERSARPAQAVAALERVHAALIAPQAPVLSASFRLNTYSRLASSYQALGRTADAVQLLSEFGRQYSGQTDMTDALTTVRGSLNQLCRSADAAGLAGCR